MSDKTMREYVAERQEQFVTGFVGKTVMHVDAHIINCVIFHLADGTRVELEAQLGPLKVPMMAFSQNPEPPSELDADSAIDELRKMVRDFDSNNETFNQRFSLNQLIQIHRMWMASKWDYYPDQWTEQQVQEALSGHPPQWNADGQPVYVHPSSGD